jgi:putative hydrolase of HD superfamily
VTDIDNLLDFVKFTHEVRGVKRAVLLESDRRKENDSEHMYQLAMTAWYLMEKDNLKLDRTKVICMALVHDAVEAYAGDVPTFSPKHGHPDKAKKEKEAAEQLKREYPEFKSLHSMIEEYELRQSPESKFVYALDKLMPMMNNYIYGGRIWRKIGLSLSWLKSSKAGKIDVSPEVFEYYQQMLRLLDKHPELFGDKI